MLLVYALLLYEAILSLRRAKKLLVISLKLGFQSVIRRAQSPEARCSSTLALAQRTLILSHAAHKRARVRGSEPILIGHRHGQHVSLT